MHSTLKGAAVSLAAIILATAAYAESASHGSGPGAVKSAAEESHGEPVRIATTEPKVGRLGGHGATWAYSGENSPSNWASVSEKYVACGEGTAQSPINLTAEHAAGSSAGNIDFSYKPTPLRILNNGHTIELKYNEGSSMTVEGATFDLLQFHFHSPSEHAVNGKLADLELHMVHRNGKGELGVVGVLMNIGEENLALGEIWQNMPKGTSPERLVERDIINARDFLPHNTNYYRYMGSLTTPPCSEGVNWFVMSDPIEVSREQVEAFAKVIGPNNRPLQNVNNRLVLAPASVN